MTTVTKERPNRSAFKFLVVDDHPAVRSGLRGVFARYPQWQVCGEVENGKDAIEKVQELRPDLVILDISMPEMNGLEATREIRRLVPDIKILILTMHEGPHVEVLIREAGADALVSKTGSMITLTTEIERLIPSNGQRCS